MGRQLLKPSAGAAGTVWISVGQVGQQGAQGSGHQPAAVAAARPELILEGLGQRSGHNWKRLGVTGGHQKGISSSSDPWPAQVAALPSQPVAALAARAAWGVPLPSAP